MFHIDIIKDGDVTKVVKETLVDGQMYVDDKAREGSTNLVTSDAVAKVAKDAGDEAEGLDTRLTAVEDCIPDTAGADNKLVTQSALDAAEAGWQAGYTPKGEASVSTLNGLTGQSNGDTYILTDSGTLTDGSLAVSAGDSVAWDDANSKWYKVSQYALEQFGTNEIHNLSTTATEADLVSGNYLAIDGSAGTKKLGVDELMRVTAENGLNPCSMGYVNTTADAENAFGAGKDVADATANSMYSVNAVSVVGLPTGAGSGGTLITLRGNTSGTSLVQSWIDISGDIYTRTSYASGTYTSWEKITTKSALDTAIDSALDNDENILKAKGYVYTIATAEAAFGNDRDVGDAQPNTMWSLQYSVCVGLPANLNGTLITLRGNTSGNSVTQIFTTETNRIYMRCRYGGNPYTSWSLLALDDALQTAITNALSSKGFINTATDATRELGAGKDVADAPANSMYSVTSSVVVGLPSDAGTGGLLFTLRGNTTGVSVAQMWFDVSGKIYMRCRYAGILNSWSRFATYSELSTAIANSPTSMGYVYTSAQAETAFGASKDVANAGANTMYAIDNSVVIGMPTGAGSGGLLFTLRGNTAGNSILQLYADISGDVYTRVRYAGTLKAWQRVAQDNYTHIIPQFTKIGALGGSYTTGASDWKDSDGVYHSVDHPELSWIQIWGRKHGVQAFNFSHGGMSTKTWFTWSDGITKAQQAGNECKVYFILFGGGNDINAYDGLTNLGTIADVHVGSEDTNPDTYFGNYSKIIATLKSIGGARTKIFAFPFAQIMNSNALRSTYNNATEAICALYDDVFFLDIEDDPVINGSKVQAQYFGGHFSAYGYKLIADRLEFYVDRYVEEHPSDFDDIQWIGSDLPIVQP